MPDETPRPFVRFRDLLRGTRAEQDRHGILRTTFMDLLLQDPRVISWFEEWEERLG